MQRKQVMAVLCALLVIAGLSGCGKRGDPYRSSEIPAKQTNSSPGPANHISSLDRNKGSLTCLHSTAIPTTI